MLYFFYIKKDIDNNKDFWGCLSVKINDNFQIEKSKITFTQKLKTQDIKIVWPWAYTFNGIHINVDQLVFQGERYFYIDQQKGKQILPEILTSALNTFKGLFEEEFEIQEKCLKVPEYVMCNTQNIIQKFYNKYSREPNKIELFSIKSYLLNKIYLFFEQNPDKVFSFPLYKESLIEMGLSEEEFTVEDFLAGIEESLSFGVELSS